MEPREFIQQISVFIENRPGRVSNVCALLEQALQPALDAGVDLVGLDEIVKALP